MNKAKLLVGYLSLGSLLLSVLFKIFHLMGAPSLLMLGFISGIIFIVLSLIQKFKG